MEVATEQVVQVPRSCQLRRPRGNRTRKARSAEIESVLVLTGECYRQAPTGHVLDRGLALRKLGMGSTVSLGGPEECCFRAKTISAWKESILRDSI